MSRKIVSQTIFEEDTGEIIDEKKWYKWDGWNDDGYKFRYKIKAIKFYPDNPLDLELNDLKIFFLICELMNDENMLVRIKKGRTKYDPPKIESLSQEDMLEEINTNLRNRKKKTISRYSFLKAWQNCNGRYIKRISFMERLVWAINPAFANRTDYLSVTLYKAFKNDIDKWIGMKNIQRYRNLIMNEGLES